MNKTSKTKAEAEKEVERMMTRFITGLHVAYLAGFGFDPDYAESSLQDSCDGVDYFEQQDALRSAFCVHSSIWRGFAKVRHLEDGAVKTDVRYGDVLNRVEKLLRAKSYNEKGTASFKPGAYSRLYIFNAGTIERLCRKWHEAKGYEAVFDLSSDYYGEKVRTALAKRLNLKIYDFNRKGTE